MTDQDLDEKPERSESETSSDSLPWRRALMSVGMALSIPSTLIVPIVSGVLLDRYFGTQPIFSFVLSLIGVLGAGVEVFLFWKRFGSGAE